MRDQNIYMITATNPETREFRNYYVSGFNEREARAVVFKKHPNWEIQSQFWATPERDMFPPTILEKIENLEKQMTDKECMQ